MGKCPGSAGFTLGAAKGCPPSPCFPSSLSPVSVGAPLLLEHLQLAEARRSVLLAHLSSHSRWERLSYDPLPPTFISPVSLLGLTAPGSSLRHPFPAEPGAQGEPGEQTQQIAERWSAAPLPSRAANRPARARCPDPRPPCSASRPAIEMQLTSLRSPDSARPSPRPAAGSQAAGRTAPHPPARRGPEAAIPRVPVVPSPSRCMGSYGRVPGILSS